MVPYYPDRHPDLTRFGLSSVQAQVVLDEHYGTYTNLDFVSGRVIVRTPASANVTNIVVKLEGESKTRLLPPSTPQNEKPKPQLEIHKLLYKLQMVFPPPEVVDQKMAAQRKGQVLTLPPGQHEYPFNFKIPFNNSCDMTKSSGPSIKLQGLNLEMSKAPTSHVKKTLPPTLGGFPGEAEIRYYVKATVSRPGMFKENARASAPFNFCPIEPPRPPPTSAETYARRRHQFEPLSSKGKKSLFSKKGSSTTSTPQDAPFIRLDARIPEASIFTCNDVIPLRIIVGSLNQYRDDLSLQSLQVELLGHTHVVAHGVTKTESQGTIITSVGNLARVINFPEGSDETLIDSSLWRGRVIPNTVAPSFETCNLSRTYELIARLRIDYHPRGSQPQSSHMELRLPVQLYSGIAPPPELLEAMSSSPARSGMPRKPVAPRPARVAGPSGTSTPGAAPQTLPPAYSDAPPSYQDVVADQLPALDAQRPRYAPPAPGEDPLLAGDEKTGWH